MSKVLIVDREPRGIVRVTLNRPDAHNALSPELTEALESATEAVAREPSLRALVLTGAGASFCAGGDIKAMRAMIGGTRAERMARSARFARLLAALRSLPVPVVARVNGPAYAGGAGLVSVADIAIAAEGARFGFTEPRIGIAPANISPYVLARVGASAARRLFLSGQRFEAPEGLRLGLYDRVVALDALDAAVEAELESILQCSPSALAACKRLIAEVPGRDSESAMAYTATLLADLWETEDAREGIDAFNEKRRPRWARND